MHQEGQGVATAARARRQPMTFTASTIRQAPGVDRTILIVDDTWETRDVYALVFEDAGYRVLCAASVREALHILRAGRVDVVLSDYSLGDGTGVDVIERATAERLLEGTPVLICTSHPHVTVPRGVSVVHKPISPGELLRAVAERLGHRRPRRSGFRFRARE
jgi:CheY-like chemotaxis protein